MLFYDYTFVSLYNLMLTAVPVLVLGATDQDLIAPYVLRYPGVYRLGIHQKRYNQYRFVAYMLDGVWQSLVVFWFWRGVYGVNMLSTSGIDASLLEFSTSVAITNVVIASLYLFSEGSFWFMLVLSVVAAFLARYTFMFVSSWWFPDDVHVVRGIMISEKRNAIAKKLRWTGLAPDGLTPQEQSEQEKALLRKEDLQREAKEAEKAEKKAAKEGKRDEPRSNNQEEQPYDLTMIQINVNDHSQSPSSSSSDPRNQRQQQQLTPLQIQEQLLSQQQRHKLKPDDPSFQYSRRTSSYNYSTLDSKPAALPPVPSPSLPSLPLSSAEHSRAPSPSSPSHSQDNLGVLPIQAQGTSSSNLYQPPSPSPLSAQIHQERDSPMHSHDPTLQPQRPLP
ncbi:hypothetical protein BGZ74_009288 [Mortierella antarctica]|nr:hypothetical protein BGZ74_009288 [Mortierella antarctica]